MSLIKEWRDAAYSDTADKGTQQRLWAEYFELEKGIYKEILADPAAVITGTVKGLAERFGLKTVMMAGVLDGMNNSLITPNPLEEMTEDTEVNMGVEPEKLYKNMVAAQADWLYELAEWEPILSEERRKELYREQKLSSTVVKGEKTYPNDPCPCGSGKKYKKCCGKV